MHKSIIKLTGILFVLWGLVNLWNFIIQNSAFGTLFLISFDFGGFAIDAFILAILLCSTGYNLFIFNASGRVLGLVILWEHLVLTGLASGIGLINFYKATNGFTSSISSNSALVSPEFDIRIMLSVFLLLIIVLSVQILTLSSTTGKNLFNKQKTISEHT